MKYEICCFCGERTGRAGRYDDSIYNDEGEGPFCEQCWEKNKPNESTAIQEIQ